MQSSINHVVVLVAFFFFFFFSHTSTKLGHIFPQPLLAILPDRLPERRHTKNDICIGLCGGKLAYCFGFLSLLLSLSCQWPSFLTFIYWGKVFWSCSLSLFPSLAPFFFFPPLSETSCFIFMILHTFTPGSHRVQAQTLLSRSTWAVFRGCMPCSRLLLCKTLEFWCQIRMQLCFSVVLFLELPIFWRNCALYLLVLA